MGTRGLLGFIQKGVYKGTFNPDNSDPPMLGNAIIRFILSHTDEELDEMITKIEQLVWISADQVKSMDFTDYQRFHFPYIHGVLDEFFCDTFPKDLSDPALRIKTFKANNPDFPPDIKDKEILKRYLPAPFPIHVRRELNNMSLIPEYDEMIHNTQFDLLERIWDGRQKYIIDETEFAQDGTFCEYAYWIDFESRVMEVEGVVERTIIVPFEDMEIGIIDCMADPKWRLERMQEAIDEIG